MSRTLRVAWLLVTMIAAFACGRAAHRGGFTLAGSTSVQPFAEKWVEAYRAGHASPEIHVQGGGSTAGVQAAESGAAAIGMCSRELTKGEAATLKVTVVARDGIVVVINPANPVTSLALADVARIYAGKLRSWKELGGEEGRITIITREEGSGTRGAFEELVMNDSRIAASALVQDSTGAVRQMVAQDPAAIGYISLGLVDSTVKPLAIGGVAGTEANIDAGTYPLVRPFLFVTKGEPEGPVADFIAWIKGPAGHALTRKEGLLPPGAAREEAK